MMGPTAWCHDQLRTVFPTSWHYTSGNRVEWEQVRNADGAILLERSYRYDLGGLRTAMEDTTRDLFEYEYDRRGFLGAVRHNGKVIEVYDYDETGNLVQGLGFTHAFVEPGDRVVKAGTFELEYNTREDG